MVFNLTLVHVLLAVGAGACVYFALREIRRRYVSIWRLFVPAFLGAFVAAGMFLAQVIAKEPPWIFGVAFLAGFAIGGVRGFTTAMHIDMYMAQVRDRSAGRRALLWVPVLLALAVCVEIAGAILGPAFAEVRLSAALVAAACAGMLAGRALVMSVRLLSRLEA